MSGNAGARIFALAAAREGRSAETAPRRSDGHRLGNHGNRAHTLTRTKTITDLKDVLAITGKVTSADKAAVARAAGVTARTVNRWWAAELNRQVQAAHRHAATTTAPIVLPRHLYRYAEPNKVQLTPDEIAFVARHTTIRAALDKFRADPTHRLSNYGLSTLYTAYANVAAPVRAGARYGASAGRKIEATFPLTGRDGVNESWSIDEYDLKVTADHYGLQVEPKVLIVRDRCSGLPLSYVVLPRAATGTDTGVVLAAAAIGYTVTHPDDPGREVRVTGVARHLTSDQGGSFLGETGAAAARRLGIGLTPVPSHQPQANGDHEVMHQSLLRHLADGPGSRRGWTDRAGNRLHHGVLPYDTVLAEVETWFLTHINTPYTSGPRRGRTRLQEYADHLEAGTVFRGHDLSAADEGDVAPEVGTRKYDPTRGIAWQNRYWLSPQLASAANPGQTVHLRQLLNPDVLYAYDAQGRFLGLLTPRDDADLADIEAVHRDRVARERFVKDRVAHPRAQAAQVDAARAQAEVAERLADAAAQEDPWTPASARLAVGNVSVDLTTGEVLPADVSNLDDEDAVANTLADMFNPRPVRDVGGDHDAP
ncbi:hypothetical protein GCM10009867_17040 [Pedococcus aerophilus]|uniref:Integrase catalytic domain-containing protein n=1 Tax=Pedococcus aerophilus TaxID=436356 RepID=A0ABN3ULL7_9MICO